MKNTMEKILSTKEIENHIKQKISVSEYESQLIEKLESAYHFTDFLNLPGTYIFSDAEGYHSIGVGDRGERYPDEKPETLEDLCWRIYWGLASSVSLDTPNRKVGDWRRDVFKMRLAILTSIDGKYGILGQKAINEILENAPYDDRPIEERVQADEALKNDPYDGRIDRRKKEVFKDKQKQGIWKKIFKK